MMMKSINLYTVFLTVLILYCSYTLAIILLFNGSVIYRVLLGLLTLLLFLYTYKNRQNLPLIGVVAYVVIAGGSLFSSRLFLPDIMVYYMSMLPILTFFMLEKKDLNRVLHGINEIICALVFVSLIIYLLVTIGGPFPHSGLQNYEQYYYYNYFYILLDTLNGKGRFSGFTLEPGYLSILVVSLLLINKFDFQKKCTWIYFLSLLCTVSLGGYLLALIGYVLQKMLEEKQIKKMLFVLGVVTIVIYIVVIIVFSYNNGNNIIVEKIFERLMFDEDLGVVGNNRENYLTADIIDTYFYSNEVWFGIGSRSLKQVLDVEGVDACSWRIFVLANGAVYTLCFFVLSILFLFKTNVKVVLPFFVIFWLDFYQHGTLYSETLYLLVMYMILNLDTKSDKMCVEKIIKRK